MQKNIKFIKKTPAHIKIQINKKMYLLIFEFIVNTETIENPIIPVCNTKNATVNIQHTISLHFRFVNCHFGVGVFLDSLVKKNTDPKSTTTNQVFLIFLATAAFFLFIFIRLFTAN